MNDQQLLNTDNAFLFSLIVIFFRWIIFLIICFRLLIVFVLIDQDIFYLIDRETDIRLSQNIDDGFEDGLVVVHDVSPQLLLHDADSNKAIY